MRPLVVGPAEPMTLPGLAGLGPLQLEGERFAGLDERDELLVRRVARLVDHAGDRDGVAGLEVTYDVVGERSCDLPGSHAPSLRVPRSCAAGRGTARSRPWACWRCGRASPR